MRSLVSASVLIVFSLSVSRPVRADFLFYVSTNARQFGYIDIDTKTFTSIRQDPNFELRSIAWDPANQTMYGEEVLPGRRVTDTVTINAATGTTTDVGTSGFNLNGLGVSNQGTMYGTSPFGVLLTVSTTTGAAKFFANFPENLHPSIGSTDLVVDSAGNIFLTAINSNNGSSTDLLEFNSTNGALIKDVGTVGFGGVNALAFINGVLYGAANDQRDIITISTTTGKGTVAFAYPNQLNGAKILDGTYAIPEPSSFVLLASALVLLALGLPWLDRVAASSARVSVGDGKNGLKGGNVVDPG